MRSNIATFPLYLLHRLQLWRIRHPRLFLIIGVLIALYVLGWVLTPFANATGDGQPSPNVPGDSLMSSEGIRASHYASLFIDHGWLLSPEKKFTASIMDFFWTMHVGVVTSGIDLIVWTLSFEWVDIIAVPMGSIASTVETLISRIGIVPFALFCSGAYVAMMVIRGKYAKAVSEYITAAIVATLALGLLASPITWITSSGGPLDTAKEWGANLSAAITLGDGNLKIEASSQEILGASVAAPLVDVLLARPAEYLSFGKSLTGDCRASYLELVKNLDPVGPDIDKVRTTTGSCDAEAKAFSDSSAGWRLIPLVETLIGSLWIWVFGFCAVIVFFIAVLITLFSGLLTTWRSALAVFPYTDRSRLLVALGGIFAGFLFIVTSQILLAGGFKMLDLGIKQMETLGWVYQLHLRVISVTGTILVIALIVLFVTLRKRAKRLAERAAKALEDIGASQKSQPLSMTPAWASDALKHLTTMKMLSPKKPFDQAARPAPAIDAPPTPGPLPHFEATPVPKASRGTGAPSDARALGGGAPKPGTGGGPSSAPVDAGELISTPVAKNQRPGTTGAPEKPGATKKLGGAAVRYALAARGGVAGLALQAATDAAGAVTKKPAIEISPNGTGTVAPPAKTDMKSVASARPSAWASTTAPTPPSQQTLTASPRIIVGPDGQARVTISADGVPPRRPVGASS